MNSKFLTLVAIAAVIAVGTYLGLNHLFPYQKEEAKVAASVPVDSVFSGGLQAPAAGEPAEAAAAPAAAPADSGGVPTEAATASPQAEQPAAEPAAETKIETAAAASKPETVAAAQPAPAAKPEPAPAPKVEPAPAPKAEPAPAKPAAAKKPEPKAAPAPEPKPAAAPSKPASAAVSKPAAAAATAKAPPPVTKVAAPAAPATQWWGAGDASHLSLVYVGSAAFQKAIVLMFNGEFAATDSANANLQVLDPKGSKVAGGWKLGPSNKRMLVFPVNSSGKYTVVVKTGLQDSSGRTVSQEARGPVTVQ